MKKLIALSVVALFATATFAQEKAEPKSAETSAKSVSHECYMMKDGAVLHCMGEKHETETKAVTLKNGTVISPKGEVTTKDGKTTKLENGQCVSMMGSVGDCEKMHASTRPDRSKETPKKAQEVEVK